MPKNATILERWTEKVLPRPDGCWEWIASRDPDGYGRFQYPIKTGQVHTRAHRWAYEFFVGPIGSLHVCHTCDHPWCVNPDHLWLGTDIENNADKVAKGRNPRLWGTPLNRSRQTHCKRGHPLEGSNLVITNGHRRCRTCHNEAQRQRYWEVVKEARSS